MFWQFVESSERNFEILNSFKMSQNFNFSIAPLMPVACTRSATEFKCPQAGRSSGFVPCEASIQITDTASSIPGQLNRIAEVHKPQSEEQLEEVQTIPNLKTLRFESLSNHQSLPGSESSLLSPPPSPPSNYVSEFIQRYVETQQKHKREHKCAKHSCAARSQTARVKPKLLKPADKENENDANKQRVCISCHITQTPCWRPSWDPKRGQLCNSCGLRYRKTRIRCSNYECSKVPSKLDLAALREEAQGRPLHCPHCQAPLIQD